MDFTKCSDIQINDPNVAELDCQINQAETDIKNLQKYLKYLKETRKRVARP